MNPQNLGEDLLRAWLELTATIWTRDLVSGLTFNEAVVCNLISHQMEQTPEAPVTATYLCEKTNMRKSQMNQVLTSLEAQGYLCRTRSESDRRRVALVLTDEGKKAYDASHEKASRLLQAVVERLGPEAACQLKDYMILANVTVQEVLSRQGQKGNV